MNRHKNINLLFFFHLIGDKIYICAVPLTADWRWVFAETLEKVEQVEENANSYKITLAILKIDANGLIYESVLKKMPRAIEKSDECLLKYLFLVEVLVWHFCLLVSVLNCVFGIEYTCYVI